MTEPQAGSAVTELSTSATREGDEVVINGSKIFSTHSPEAGVFLVYVRFGPGTGGIGSVLIERGTPGFTVGQPSRFMRSEEHTSELQSLMRISYAVFCLKKKTQNNP